MVYRILSTALASAAAAATLAAPAAAAANGPAVRCEYQFNAWHGGFMANLIIHNDGPALNGWTAEWTFPTPTVLGTAWSTVISEPEPGHVVARNVSYNATIPTGGVVAIGWTALADSTGTPTDITVNGTPC